MKKLLKFLAALLLLLVVGLVFATYLVNLNNYKDEIQDGFAAATGHDLVILGPLRVVLFPKPVLEIRQASVPGAFGNQGPALAETNLVRLYPRWAPLLAGRLELASVRVEGLRMYLIRDEQGRANWDTDKVPPVPRGAVGAIGPWNPIGPSRSPGLFNVVAAEADPAPAIDWPPIGRVEILEAQVTWDDYRSGQRLKLDDLEFRASPVAPGRPIAWRVTGLLRVGDEGRLAALRAEGEARVGVGPWPLRLEPLTVRVEGFDLGLGLATDLLLRTGIDANPDSGCYLAEQANLEVQAFGAALITGRIKAKVDARVDLDLGAERLQVADLVLRSGTLAASGSALGENLLSVPVIVGDLKVEEFDLRAWLAQRDLPLPLTVAETFRRCALGASWRLEKGWLGLSDLVLGVDETRFTGRIDQVLLSPLGLRFDLVADRLDLDSYLPPVEQAAAQPGERSQRQVPVTASAATPEGADGKTSTRSGAAGLVDNLDLEGRLRIRELLLARLRFGDADLRVRAKGRDLDIDNRVPRFYEGVVTGRVGVDMKGAEPRIALVQRGKGIQAGRLLADLGWGNTLSGRGEVNADLTTTGSELEALRRSLDGTLAIHFPRGAIKGINLERLIREAKARLQGKTPPADLPTDTEFKDLRATAEIRKGVLSNQDLVVTADHLRVTGTGTLDLVRKGIDYRLKLVFVKPPQGRGIKELEGIPIPVHLTGTFDHPQWDLDLGSALNAAAKRQLGEQGGDLLQAIEERTGIKGLEEGLKGLLGR